jgi:CBS domain-containing protein/acyl dehydratase
MLKPISVREVMYSPVQTIESAESGHEAAERLHENGIGSLVVTTDGDPVGIVTEADVTGLVAEGRDPSATTLEEFMSSPLVSIGATESIEHAAQTMRGHNIRRLPVVDDNSVVGIVTTTDLSNYLPHLIRMGREDVPPEGRERKSIRVDTAYERDEWDFEYLGDEAQIDVGDTVRFSKTISEEDVEAFAEASGDTNRLHMDDEFAKTTRFGKRIAHGTLVGGIISSALARLPGLIIYLSQDMSYLGPVPLEEYVTAECEVIENIGDNRFRLSTTVKRSDGETVIDGEAVVVSNEISEDE